MRLFYDVGHAVRWMAGAISTVVMTIIDAVVLVVQSAIDAVANVTARLLPRTQITSL